MNFEAWLDDLKGDDNRATAAKKAGYAQSTITRQLGRGYLRPETVISLCRAYNRSPVDGLVETGYLYSHEVEGVGVEQALDMASNEQVLKLIERRMTAKDDVDFRGAGDDNVIGLHRPVSFGPDLFSVADSSPDEGPGYPDDYEP